MSKTINAKLWCLFEHHPAFDPLLLPQRTYPLIGDNDLACLPKAIEALPLSKFYQERNNSNQGQYIYVNTDASNAIQFSASELDYLASFYEKKNIQEVELVTYYSDQKVATECAELITYFKKRNITVHACVDKDSKTHRVEDKTLFHPNVDEQYTSDGKTFKTSIEGHVCVADGYSVSNRESFLIAAKKLHKLGHRTLVLKGATSCSGKDIYYFPFEQREMIADTVLPNSSWVLEGSLTKNKQGLFVGIQFKGQKIIEEAFVQETTPKLQGVHSSYYHQLDKAIYDTTYQSVQRILNYLKPAGYGSIDFYFDPTTGKSTLVDINLGRLTLVLILKFLRHKLKLDKAKVSAQFYQQGVDYLLPTIQATCKKYPNQIIPLVIGEVDTLIAFIDDDSRPDNFYRNYFNEQVLLAKH